MKVDYIGGMKLDRADFNPLRDDRAIQARLDRGAVLGDSQGEAEVRAFTNAVFSVGALEARTADRVAIAARLEFELSPRIGRSGLWWPFETWLRALELRGADPVRFGLIFGVVVEQALEERADFAAANEMIDGLRALIAGVAHVEREAEPHARHLGRTRGSAPLDSREGLLEAVAHGATASADAAIDAGFRTMRDLGEQIRRASEVSSQEAREALATLERAQARLVVLNDRLVGLRKSTRDPEYLLKLTKLVLSVQEQGRDLAERFAQIEYRGPAGSLADRLRTFEGTISAIDPAPWGASGSAARIGMEGRTGDDLVITAAFEDGRPIVHVVHGDEAVYVGSRAEADVLLAIVEAAWAKERSATDLNVLSTTLRAINLVRTALFADATPPTDLGSPSTPIRKPSRVA
jgi:hypothetical protein